MNFEARKVLSQFEPRMLLSVLGVLGLVGAVALTIAAFVGDLDEIILLALRDPQDIGQLAAPYWVESVVLNYTSLGGWPVLLLVGLGVLGFFFMKRAWLESALLGASAIGGVALAYTLKWFFGRERPTVVPHLIEVAEYSFPSGHAMMSAIVYLTLGTVVAEFLRKRTVKAYVLGMAFVITFVVGSTRVVLGVHYPSDVLAGWCLGTLWALGCWLGIKWLEFRLDPENFELPGAREDSVEAHA